MSDLNTYWDKSSSTIPDDKDPSEYAMEKEQYFPQQTTICDLGCGTGIDGLYFASRGHTVTLVDISEVALSRAEKLARKRGLGNTVSVFQCNLDESKIPLDSATYNVVYSRLALHYFKPEVLAELFKEIYRILKLGGIAYLTLKSPDDIDEMKYLESTTDFLGKGIFEEDGHIKTRFSILQLDDIISKSGINPKEVRVQKYTENLADRKDKIKSGNKSLLLNEIEICKT